MNQTSSERISEYLWKTCVTRSWWVMGEADVFRTFLRSLSVLQTSSKTLGGFMELIQYGGNGKWGHPRWWPEAERPPFSTIHHHGVPKTHPILLLRPDDHWNAPNRKCIDKVGYQSNNDLFCKMKMRSLFCFIWVGTGRADQRKHQSSASLAFVRGIHR